MPDTPSQPPKCEKCGQPMEFLETVEAEKQGRKVTVDVFTCYRDRTFKRKEETW